MKAAALAPGLALLAAACGAPRSYMGLDLRPAPGGLSEVQMLAQAASGSDRAAQLELAERFEFGRGVPEDFDRACRLYESAGATTGGTIFVYSPPVGKAKAGTMIPITRPVVPGLPVARERLAALAYRASPAERAQSTCLARHR